MPTSAKRVEVTTLTAQVKVLMVGSRQVTLSVFCQLDVIPFDEVVPMGRVRPKEKGLWMVGVDSDGNLVRSQVIPPDLLSSSEINKLRISVDGIKHFYWRSEEERQQRLDKATSELEEALESNEEEKKRFARQAKLYSELPLIVLAGLR